MLRSRGESLLSNDSSCPTDDASAGLLGGPQPDSLKYIRYILAVAAETIRNLVRRPWLPLSTLANRVRKSLTDQSAAVSPQTSEIRAPDSNRVLAMQSSRSFHPNALPAV